MRSRSLSKEGCRLLNIAYEKDTSHINLAALLCSYFTSDYDIKLEESCNKLRESTYRLYSYLNCKDIKTIPKLINNAITNIIILILTNNNEIAKIHKVKQNYKYYLAIAKEAYKQNDHQTAIVIRTALNNFNIIRLNLKINKRDKEFLDLLEKEYGTFKDCCAGHLRQILLKRDAKQFLPSLMILLVHLNKTKEYAKCYETIGTFPKELRNKQKELENIVDLYYKSYKNYDEKIIHLYEENPNDNPILSKMEGPINAKLFEISCQIKKGKVHKRK